MRDTMAELDERDQAILDERVQQLDEVIGPRVGDYVVFTDGTTRRISFVWDDGVQTSAGGSFYLGNGYVSFSGSLYTSVPFTSLTQTDERRAGSAWFFHHDRRVADNGVDVMVMFRVYLCDRLPAI